MAMSPEVTAREATLKILLPLVISLISGRYAGLEVPTHFKRSVSSSDKETLVAIPWSDVLRG
jgi:hypothetical protein